MNWETAKTWLIVAFLVLDMVLGWQIYESRKALQGYVESYSDLLANTKTMLADHGLTLVAQVPQTQPDIPSFKADYVTPNMNAVWHAAFPKDKGAAVNINTGVIVTQSGRLKLLSLGNWQVTYNNAINLPANASVLPYVWQGNLYQEDPVSGLTNMPTYDLSYKGYPIFDTSVTAESTGGALLGYTQTDIQNITPTGDAKPVISALDALDSLADSVDKTDGQSDNRILRVDLGYAHKISVSPFQTTSPRTSYWFPVWRVCTDMQVYYINALTGEVDTVS